MTKHTPGPWLISGEPDRGLVVYAEDDTTGADLCHVEDADNANANARLIAAAPELLEALAAIVDRLSAWEEGARISGDDNARVNYSLLCGTAYSAIAKATGATD